MLAFIGMTVSAIWAEISDRKDNNLRRLPDHVFAQLLSYLTLKEEGLLRRTCSEMYDRVTYISKKLNCTRPLYWYNLENLPTSIIDSDINFSLSLNVIDLVSNKELLLKHSPRIIKLHLYMGQNFLRDYSAIKHMNALRDVTLIAEEHYLEEVTMDIIPFLPTSLKSLSLQVRQWLDEDDAMDHLELPEYAFSSLTSVELFLPRGERRDCLSPLLINGQQTIEHLTLILDESENLCFIANIRKLKNLTSLKLVGGNDGYDGITESAELPKILDACSDTLECLTLEHMCFSPLSTAKLTTKLRKLTVAFEEPEVLNNDGLMNLLTSNSNTLEHLHLSLTDFASIKAEFKNLKHLNLYPLFDDRVSKITDLIKQAPNLETLQVGHMNWEFSELSQFDESVSSLKLSTLKLVILNKEAFLAALIIINKAYKTLKCLDLVLRDTAYMEDLLKHCQSVEFLRLEFRGSIHFGSSSTPRPSTGLKVPCPRLQKFELELICDRDTKPNKLDLEDWKRGFFGDFQVETSGWLVYDEDEEGDPNFDEMAVEQKSCTYIPRPNDDNYVAIMRRAHYIA